MTGTTAICDGCGKEKDLFLMLVIRPRYEEDAERGEAWMEMEYFCSGLP